MNIENLVSVPEAARRVGITGSAMYYRIAVGSQPSVKVGGYMFVDVTTLPEVESV